MARLGALALALWLGAAEAQVLATRIWPARDYTRVTIESKRAIDYTLFSIKDPDRLILELDKVELDLTLTELPGKVTDGDPYIQQLRVARNRPGVVRLVFDLKGEVKTQLFTLKPIADYGHRLVLDIYPAAPQDALALLIESGGKLTPLEEQRAGTPAPKGGTKPPAMIRLATIVVDAGHGGEDPGARGRRGTREKDVTLIIARRLKELVNAEPEMRAVLTRDGDYYLGLGSRVEKARQLKPDLFVSIHADAFIRPNARGSSVYALSQRRATSESASWLAKKGDEADLIGGVKLDRQDNYVKRTLLDLSRTGTIDHSLKAGGAVLAALGQVNTLHKPRVEQASFAVLTAPDMPSILIETAFISNPEEEKKLKDLAYQDKLARAILAGIKSYLAKNPPRPASPLALN